MEWSMMKRYFPMKFLMGFAMCALVAFGVMAQTGTTSIHGVVTDKSGATVAAAKVTLLNPGLSLQRSIDSGAGGEFEFLALQPGTYEISVEAAGFRKFQQKNIQSLVNLPTTVTVVLEVGSSTQTVEVSAIAQTLNTTDASLGNAFNENQVKQLPLEGRNVPDLLSLQPGVAYTGNRSDVPDFDTRSGAVNGARSDQSNVTVDGIASNDEGGKAFNSVLPVTLDSVQEFRVTTTNYNADQGGSSGAQVALVTKSGTNSFHGSAYEYHRNTFTSANDYFVKAAQLDAGEPNKPPELIRNIFGGSVGGPILKNRLYFFANFEAERQAFSKESVVRVVPSAAMRDGVIMYNCADLEHLPGHDSSRLDRPPRGTGGRCGCRARADQDDGPGWNRRQRWRHGSVPEFIPAAQRPDGRRRSLQYEGFRFPGAAPIKENWYIARVDYKLTSNGNHTLFWRGALRNDNVAGVPYLPGQGPESDQVDYSKGFSVGYTAVVKSNLINNFRWGYTRQSLGVIGNQTAPVVFFRGLNDNSSTNNSSLAVTPTTAYQVPVHNFVDDVSWIKGHHTLQFGMNLNFLRNPNSSNSTSYSSAVTNASWYIPSGLANQGGAFDPGAFGFAPVDQNFNNNYDYPMITLIGSINQVNAQYNFNKNGSTIPQGAPIARNFADDAYEMYAQDSWKIKPNLTVTYGLRYSLFSPPWETNGNQVGPDVNISG